MTEQRLAQYQPDETQMLTPVQKQVLIERIKTIREISQSVMQQGTHYATIPGTPKPSLLQPGAETLAATFGLAPDFRVIREVEDFNEPFFAYRVRCELQTMQGWFAGSAEAAWNSKEARYYDRDRREYKQDPYSLQETGLLMARKRAFVAAVRTVTGASALFTQDMDDFDEGKHPWLKECPVHGEPFFMKGKMKSPAHKDGDKWCNQSTALFQVTRDAADAMDWDNARVKAWLEEEYGGSFSKLMPEQQAEAAQRLSDMVREQAQQEQPEPALRQAQDSAEAGE